MRQIIREIEENVTLCRDDKSGLAWIEDGKTGNKVSVHANIDNSGSVSGMKKLGYWKNNAKTVKSCGFIYNIDTFVCNENDKLEKIVAEECLCDGCRERKSI